MDELQSPEIRYEESGTLARAALVTTEGFHLSRARNTPSAAFRGVALAALFRFSREELRNALSLSAVFTEKFNFRLAHLSSRALSRVTLAYLLYAFEAKDESSLGLSPRERREATGREIENVGRNKSADYLARNYAERREVRNFPRVGVSAAA